MAALYPDVRLTASIGALADVLAPMTDRYAIGPAITWSLRRDAVRARIAAARSDASADDIALFLALGGGWS